MPPFTPWALLAESSSGSTWVNHVLASHPCAVSEGEHLMRNSSAAALFHASAAGVDSVLRDVAARNRAALEKKGERCARGAGGLKLKLVERDVLFGTDGNAMQVAESLLRNDYNVVRTAVASDGRALEWASERLRNNRVLARIAMELDGSALEYASKRLREMTYRDALWSALRAGAPWAATCAGPLPLRASHVRLRMGKHRGVQRKFQHGACDFSGVRRVPGCGAALPEAPKQTSHDQRVDTPARDVHSCVWV